MSRGFTPSKKKLKNLTQYRDLSEEEFEKIYKEKFVGENTLNFINLEERKSQLRDRLAADYDLDDMKANDLIQLDALILAMIQLDDLENYAYVIRQEISPDNAINLERINKIITALRNDISSLSTDLQLVKKARDKNREVSLAQRWDNLTKRAGEFYKSKMLYIYCTKCKTLLATVWLIFPDGKNKLSLHCDKCENSFDVELAPLYLEKNKNLPDVMET